MTNEEIREKYLCRHCANYGEMCFWKKRQEKFCQGAIYYKKGLEQKDKLFKRYLEKKRDSFNKDAEKWFSTKNLEHIGVISKYGWSVINEIINELFKEEEIEDYTERED